MRFHHNLGDLERDFERSARDFQPAAARAVERTAKIGWRKAFRLAKRRSGKHGSRYPYAIDLERNGLLEFEYFTNPDKPQGGMAFEVGSRNQAAPHPDFAQSTDGLVDKLQQHVGAAQRRTWRVT